MRLSLPRLKYVYMAVCAALLLCTVVAVPSAYADQISTLQQKVEQTAKDYNNAQRKYKDITAKISKNEQRISELQKKLPQQRAHAAEAARSLYKFQQGSPNLITLILSTDNFENFLSMVTYLSSIQTRNTDVIKELVSMQSELKERSQALMKQKDDAIKDLNNSKMALQAATNARRAAQEKAKKEAEEQQKAAEEAVKAAQKAAAQKKNDSFKTNTSYTAPVETPVKNPTVSMPDISSDKDRFIAKWAPRIDRYLAGSPMAHTGKAFAAAAWDAGVDPRWSPAIATIESGKGRAIPNRNGHNAWGWTKVGGGFRAFSSWESAIDAHVHYLARVYGPTITPKAARIYCPPNWQYWYSSVLSQMQRI